VGTTEGDTVTVDVAAGATEQFVEEKITQVAEPEEEGAL
jgi:hypothetical protein